MLLKVVESPFFIWNYNFCIISTPCRNVVIMLCALACFLSQWHTNFGMFFFYLFLRTLINDHFSDRKWSDIWAVVHVNKWPPQASLGSSPAGALDSWLTLCPPLGTIGVHIFNCFVFGVKNWLAGEDRLECPNLGLYGSLQRLRRLVRPCPHFWMILVGSCKGFSDHSDNISDFSRITLLHWNLSSLSADSVFKTFQGDWLKMLHSRHFQRLHTFLFNGIIFRVT